METLYVASTEPYSGKSGVILGLGLGFQEKGLSVGFMKPLSTLPTRIEGVLVDEDAFYIWKHLGCEYSIESVSPMVLSSQFIREFSQELREQRIASMMATFERVSREKDIVLLEGAADLWQGRFLEMSACQTAELFDSRVLLIAKAQSDFIVDQVLVATDILKERLLGVVFNFVPENFMETMKELVVPILADRGVKTFGIIPEDQILRAVTVGEIAEHLGGQVLCATEKMDDLVEEFMVGAMSQEHALRYFRRKQNKAVITGGDRSDVQLAALETLTKCIILTGNFQPSPVILARAEELGIPMILVDVDTYTAVEHMEALIGQVGLHQKTKIERMRRLLTQHVNLLDLAESIGLR